MTGSEKDDPITALDWQYMNGYRDGRKWWTRCPDAAHPAYKHSFKVGRAEINGKPIPASVSRGRVAMIDDAFSNPAKPN